MAAFETTQNLYQLSLLNRPKKGPYAAPRSSTSSRSMDDVPVASNRRTVREENLERQREKLVRITGSQHFDRPQTSKPQSAPVVPSLEKRLRSNSSTHRGTVSARPSSRPTTAMLDSERSRTRRERTFVGSECAVCEEPLEHTLRGERVLQFSCAHVSHEACFYEYIKESDLQYCPSCDAPLQLDSNRGGNVLDIGKLSNIVRSVAQSGAVSQRDPQNTPMPWNTQSNRERQQSTPNPWDGQSTRERQGDGHYGDRPLHNRDSRDVPFRHEPDTHRDRGERLGLRQQISDADLQSMRQSPSEFTEGQQVGHERRHDYDVHAMESALSSPRGQQVRNPIPAPVVTVRSEFPTLNRSRQVQSLTCLVTVEVPEGKWHPSPEDLRRAPPVPPIPQEDSYKRVKPHKPSIQSRESTLESQARLDEVTEELKMRVDNWHGLDFQRFGKLRLHGKVRVGKDHQSWQELECYLFAEMLICVKEKKGAQPQIMDGTSKRKLTRCTLKGSIIIERHLKSVQSSPDEPVLTLNLSVNDLPSFHLHFQNRNQLELWRRAFIDLENPGATSHIPHDYEQDTSGTDDDEYSKRPTTYERTSSAHSSFGVGTGRSSNTAPTEYSYRGRDMSSHRPPSLHVPLDIVVVIPVSSSMQGLKITLLRDALKFLVQNLGERDRMGLVTFGSNGGGVPLVGMTTKAWSGWNKALNTIRPVGQKSLRTDVVEGAIVAMDLLMQRKSNNPISTILLISDSANTETESVDFVVQRAEAAKVAIHSFGLGLTHKPEILIELSSRTKSSYIYVKDWMMLRECVAGCLGSLQTTSHQNVKLKLKLPEGSPARFVKISGALQITKRATGKDAEASLGDLTFGDKRDILVQLAISPDNILQEQAPQDPWESIVSGLEALGGNVENEDQRVLSIEEVPLLQADLSFGDILRDGTVSHLPRPSLLTITMLPVNPRSKQSNRPSTPPIPPHPSIVQRRMELLTSDMLTRALTLVSRGQHERAQHLLHETRTILKGLGKGGLPPLPPTANATTAAGKGHSPSSSQGEFGKSASSRSASPDRGREISPHSETSTIGRSSGVDSSTMSALDADIDTSLEWINHPAVFSRDSRKAVLQAIGVISSQRAYTFRTPSEALWADRVAGVRSLTERSREWRETGDDALTEES